MDVGASLVAYGHAWANRRYITDPYLISLEEKAKEKQIGLWALPIKDRSPPWAWKNAEKYKNLKFVFKDRVPSSKHFDSLSEHDLPVPTSEGQDTLRSDSPINTNDNYDSSRSSQRKNGCGGRGGPRFRKDNGQCASWRDVK